MIRIQEFASLCVSVNSVRSVVKALPLLVVIQMVTNCHHRDTERTENSQRTRLVYHPHDIARSRASHGISTGPGSFGPEDLREKIPLRPFHHLEEEPGPESSANFCPGVDQHLVLLLHLLQAQQIILLGKT